MFSSGHHVKRASFAGGIGFLIVFAVLLDLIPFLDAWVRTDRDIHQWFFDVRRPWLVDVMRLVSDLIDWTGALILVVVVSVLALRIGHRREAVFMVLTAAGAYALSTALKEVVGRVRPDVIYQAVLIDSPSFPSGHALHSVAFYGAAAFLVNRWTGEAKARFLAGFVVFMALLTGVSRLYLGVHWPTDVLGGWLLGVCWFVFCTSLFRWFETRRMLSDERVGIAA